MTALKNIDAVILCGGQGQRLRTVIGPTQKTMARVQGRPFLDILLDDLSVQGLRRIVLCTGYRADQVEAYYREKKSALEIHFSREENPLGTGGAVKKARPFVRSHPFFVLNGDSFCPMDYKKFLAFHQKNKADGTIAVTRISDPQDLGSIVLDDQQRMVGFQEKVARPKSNVLSYVNAGVYCFNNDIFSLMPSVKRFSLEKSFFPQQKNFFGFEVKKEFVDIGTPERYGKAKNGLGV